MFFNLLNPTQKYILTKLVEELIQADGQVTFAEDSYFMLVIQSPEAKEFEANLKAVGSNFDPFNEAPNHFKTKQEQFLLISTLMTAAFLDNVSHPTELSLIVNLMNSFQLNKSPDYVKLMLLWSQRQANQFNEASFLALTDLKQ